MPESTGLPAAFAERVRRWPVEWVTFDCYGTLIDWEGGVADALAPLLPPPVDRRALAARYIAVEAEVEHEAYRPYRDVLAEASARLMRSLGHPLPAGRERVLPESLERWRPFPEVAAALRALRQAGRRLAILSNVDRDLLASSIAQLGSRAGCDRHRRGRRQLQAGPGPLDAVPGEDRRGPGPDGARRGEPVPRHEPRGRARIPHRLHQPPRRAARRRAADPRAPRSRAAAARRSPSSPTIPGTER